MELESSDIIDIGLFFCPRSIDNRLFPSYHLPEEGDGMSLQTRVVKFVGLLLLEAVAVKLERKIREKIKHG